MNKNVEQQCPGDDPARRRRPEFFACPKCAGEVEIWMDESAGTCSGCQSRFSRRELEET